jgi:hypothetical protein
MINHRIKFITSPNLSLLESEANNWLEEEMNINVREMSLHTNVGGYEMAIMIWYDYMDTYSKEEKRKPNREDDREMTELEKAAKISSARA